MTHDDDGSDGFGGSRVHHGLGKSGHPARFGEPSH